MADEGDEVGPVAHLVLRVVGESLPQGGTVHLYAGEHPARSGPGVGQNDVVGADEPGSVWAEQLIAQHVGAQQHLALAAGERAQVDGGAGKLDAAFCDSGDAVGANEYVPIAGREQ